MSNWKVHIIFSFIFCILAILLVYFAKKWDLKMLAQWKLLIFIIPTIVVFGVLPDIDNENSKIHQYLIGSSIILALAGYMILLFFPSNIFIKLLPLGLILGIFSLITSNLSHHGFIHSILFIFLSAVFLVFIHWSIFIFAILSGISRLILDKELKLI